jgi:hypothetical protein
MDPRPEQIARHLQRHWVALAGVAAAALIGGGAGKALSPRGLYEDPQPAQLISEPHLAQQADFTTVSWTHGPPDYVVGTDVTRPREAALPPISSYAAPAGDAPAQTEATDAHAAEAVANEAVGDADHRQATDAGQAASSDSSESYPAMAPG